MIGDRLKALRESRNLTQEQVAKAVGVRKQTVSSWETNKSIPSLQNLLELIKCLSYKFSKFTCCSVIIVFQPVKTIKIHI